MRKISVVTTYLYKKNAIWMPNSFFGILWRSIFFLVILTVFILLFCIPLTREQGDIPVPHTGDVQIFLSWGDINDLDICCIDPQGERIDYKNMNSQSGGCLDIDMNAELPYRRSPIENIYWSIGGAPSGEYKVYLTFFNQHSLQRSSSEYKIVVKYNGKEEEYSGTITKAQKEIFICSFVVE